MFVNVEIDVTQEDIDSGKAGNCYGCPVALAINRILAESYRSSVAGTIGIGDGVLLKEVFCVTTPIEARVFIRNFDCYSSDIHRSPVPFKFTMSLPEELLKSGVLYA